MIITATSSLARDNLLRPADAHPQHYLPFHGAAVRAYPAGVELTKKVCPGGVSSDNGSSSLSRSSSASSILYLSTPALGVPLSSPIPGLQFILIAEAGRVFLVSGSR